MIETKPSLDSLTSSTPDKPYQKQPIVDFNVQDVYAGDYKGAVDPSGTAIRSVVDNLRQIPGIRSEGMRAGSEAANALFSSNTANISKALQQKANRSFQRAESRRNTMGAMDGFQRQRIAMAKDISDRQKMFELRKANFAGQLRWADEVTNYNNAMEATKIGLLGSIIGGGGKMLGMAMGKPPSEVFGTGGA